MSDLADLETEIAAAAPEVLSRMNGDYGDSMAFVGRVLGERPRATAARAVQLTSRSVTMAVTDPDGDTEVELAFAAPVTRARGLNAALLSLVRRARELSGEEGQTSAEEQLASLTAFRTFVTEVVDVTDVHPHLRRITFGGGDLATFTPAGPDTFLYVLVPPPGRSELTIDQSFTWEAYYGMPEEVRPVGAYYTLRRWDPQRQRLEMLFVLHGDDGPASAWAGRARPGDPAALWGPRTAFEPPAGTDRYLLVADETGLPAVAAILESLAEDVPVQVLAEVSGEEWHPLLPERPSVAVTWLPRQGAEAGTTSLLGDAVAALEPLEGSPYVWGGGESRGMTAVRKVVRREWGLSRDAVSLVAYWRHAAHLGDPDDED